MGPAADRGRAARCSTARCALGGRGPYVLQAAIASLHAEDPARLARRSPRCTASLRALTGSPVVELNRAVAVAETDGPSAALALVDRLELDAYRYLHSTRADLLRRLGRHDDARTAYGRALELATTDPERRFLKRRIEECR